MSKLTEKDCEELLLKDPKALVEAVRTSELECSKAFSCRCLGQIKDADLTLPVLIEISKDSDFHNQEEAICSIQSIMHRMKVKQDIYKLVILRFREMESSDPNPEIRTLVSAALALSDLWEVE